MEIGRAIKLLCVDFTKKLEIFPKDRIVVIRNKEDSFFCNDESVAYLKHLGVKVIELEGGHNWNQHTELEMLNYVSGGATI